MKVKYSQFSVFLRVSSMFCGFGSCKCRGSIEIKKHTGFCIFSRAEREGEKVDKYSCLELIAFRVVNSDLLHD